MSRNSFNTVSDELILCADALVNHLRSRSYRVKIEPNEIGYPNTPTIVAIRDKTTLIIEVDSNLKSERLNSWTRFAKSKPKDTRIAFATDQEANTNEDDFCRDNGIGLFIYRNNKIIETAQPKDLAVQLSLPDLKTMPSKVRSLLTPAYDQFDNSFWREGFEEACKVLETQARSYLKRHHQSGRIIVITTSGGIKNLTIKQIDRMTLGQLAVCFTNFKSPNQADTIIGKALQLINKDRIGVVHKKNMGSTETRLRRNVSQHVWTIAFALKEIQK